ncbi:MAG TPA: sigma-70 family RNA polymerase sigma factor [Planctomycetota bacterium]
MSASDPTQVTQLLQRLSAGDAQAAHDLLPLVYAELRALAAGLLRDEAARHTLQPTALVHEAYLRLAGAEVSPDWEGHRHFLGVAAKAMRSVLIDHARRKRAEKRGGAAERLPLEGIVAAFEERVPDLFALDEALVRLEALDAELAQLVELRFFAGLTLEETARALGTSVPTVVRTWHVARLWLQRELA